MTLDLDEVQASILLSALARYIDERTGAAARGSEKAAAEVTTAGAMFDRLVAESSR